MLESISNFCSSIICTVMMIIILEMILPEGKNKKYVTFVCGIVVTIILVEPIISLLNIDIDEVFTNVNADYEEIKINENLYEESVRKTYEQNLIYDITNRLKENGYDVSNIKVEYDEQTLKPIRIYMDLESNDGYIQPVKIEVSTIKINQDIHRENELSKKKIKNIIHENYDIKKENIIVN